MDMNQWLKFTLCFLVGAVCSYSYGQAPLQKEKLNQYTWSSLSKALWDPVKKKHISHTIDMHFYCSGKNTINVSLLRLPEKTPSPAVIRIQTGYTPPSRKGFMQFIYTAEWSADRKKLLIHQHNQNTVEDFMRLRTQVFKNQEMGKQEYQEKIQYCQKLKNSQKCYQSSSNYQVGEASIILEVDFTSKSNKFYFAFDPTPLEFLKKLSCYSRAD